MKCPKCGNEIQEGKLLCEKCGEEVKFVPDFDLEVETEINETLSNLVKNVIFPENEQKMPEDEEEAENGENWQEPRIHRERTTAGSRKKRLIVIGAGIVIGIAAVVTGVVKTVEHSMYSSYDYQYSRALECAVEDHFDEAIAYLERALALEPSQLEARFLLAKYYDRNGQVQSAALVLEELLRQQPSNEEEVYDLLLSIYEKREEYQKMGEALKKCEISSILDKYNQYLASEPQFNYQEGVYDDMMSITMESDTDGFIYYTLDGSEPSKNSTVYEIPLELEAGEYVIKAMFVNMYGVESDVVIKTYYINLTVPKEPDINLISGSYSEPQFIEVFHDTDTRIFYTLDGTTPTEKSLRYTEPLEMPYGTSNFSIVAINEAGVSSQVVRRTFQLAIQANFTTDLAIQVLMNNLWASGEIVDLQGHVQDRLGYNSYQVDTVVYLNDALYYIVSEEYVDTIGKAHDTHNLFAVDTNTAELFQARKIAEGQYYLLPME